MITYTFGTVIIIETFNADELAKQKSLETWGVIPPRPNVKVSRMLLKVRTSEDMQYTKPDTLLSELGALVEQEEW